MAGTAAAHIGLNIILKLMRENGKVLHFTAHQGTFQQMQGGRVAQMLRIRLGSELACIPEVGANKYALNIRFIAANYAAKTALFEQDVPFELTFCASRPAIRQKQPVVTCPHCGKEHQWDTDNRFGRSAASAAS